MTEHRRPHPADMIRQLVDEHQHVEAREYDANGTHYTTRHHVTAPALLDQLQDTDRDNAGRYGSSGYESKPVVNIEALDTFTRIDIEAARWVRDMGLDDPGDTKACVRLAGSLLPQATRCTTEGRRENGCCLHHDIPRWWTAARVASGWDTPPWKPNNTCPLCGKRGTLRVRDTDLSAICVACKETWTSDTIGLLADHIRAENNDTDTPPDEQQEEAAG